MCVVPSLANWSFFPVIIFLLNGLSCLFTVAHLGLGVSDQGSVTVRVTIQDLVDHLVNSVVRRVELQLITSLHLV